LTPEQLAYGFFADIGQSADDYVEQEEGTFDPETGAFLCDGCYIEFGMPTGPRGGWKATPANLFAIGIEREIEIRVEG
jgi:hypothetical protein